MPPMFWPFYPLAFLHDAARCLALAHQGQLRVNARGNLQPGSVMGLAQAMILKPARPTPRSEAQAPQLSFVIALLGAAGLLGAIEDTLRMTNTAHDWLALPAVLQVGALRQVWWRSPTLDGRWLPRTRRQRPLDSYWRQVILEICDWLTQLPADHWTQVSDSHTYLASQGVLGSAPVFRPPHVHRARQRQTLDVANLLLDFVLPVLGLIECQVASDSTHQVRPTLEGLKWLRDALDRGQHLANPPQGVAVEDAVTGHSLFFPAPVEPPIRMDNDLQISVDLAAPATYTFELAHCAVLLTPGPPARYQLTRRSLERAIAWGYSLSEISFLLARFGEEPLPPEAAAQLAAWREGIACVRCQPGYRLIFAGPAILAGLRQRQPFRRRTRPLASSQDAWVSQSQAHGLWRYLSRLGYVLQELLASPTHRHTGPPVLAPALHQALPLTPLGVALGTYRELRRAIPALAELPPLADLEAALVAALSPDEQAAAQQLLASHAALLARHVAPLEDGETPSDAAATHPLAPRLAAAIRAGRVLEFQYVDTRARLTRRTVRPLRLEQHQGQDYLVAFCELRNEERHFRLDRILGWE